MGVPIALCRHPNAGILLHPGGADRQSGLLYRHFRGGRRLWRVCWDVRRRPGWRGWAAASTS